MSTRCNVIIKDEYDTMYFYRHSDGYPSGVAETLNKFVTLVNNGVLRTSVGQSAGWLILLGAEEYKVTVASLEDGEWKVGAYEPTTEVHGDIEYLYVIAMEGDRAKCYVIDKDFMNWKDQYWLFPELQDGAQYE